MFGFAILTIRPFSSGLGRPCTEFLVGMIAPNNRLVLDAVGFDNFLSDFVLKAIIC